MEKTGDSDQPARTWGGARNAISWMLVLPTAVLLIFAVATMVGEASHLGYLASKATVFDTWAVLSIASVLLAVAAVGGAGLAFVRRRPILAVAFATLALPTPLLMAGSRCDTAQSCQALGWAALPPRAFAWRVRFRPVIDPNEASAIASGVLSTAGSKDSTYRAKRFEDHWIVSTINDDGWQGAHAIKIDTRTGETKLVDCPADRIRCGMEKPVRSDGQRLFRSNQLGLAAVFPDARPVCTARDDNDNPRGFFTMVREADIPCEILDGSRQMGLEVVQARKNGCASAVNPSLPWRPLSPEVAKLFRDGAPKLGGRSSLACEVRLDDQIEIVIYADAASRSYEGYIVTTPAHLAADIRSFETFLSSVSIGLKG